jgi:hypothetical protein
MVGVVSTTREHARISFGNFLVGNMDAMVRRIAFFVEGSFIWRMDGQSLSAQIFFARPDSNDWICFGDDRADTHLFEIRTIDDVLIHHSSTGIIHPPDSTLPLLRILTWDWYCRKLWG